MAIYSPMTKFIKDISERLKKLNMPILFKLPEPSFREPFIVIGSHSNIDWRTAKIGNLIEDTSLNIDIYLPNNSRTNAEEIRSKAVRLIGRREGVDSTLLIENSIGREVYHIPIRITEIIV